MRYGSCPVDAAWQLPFFLSDPRRRMASKRPQTMAKRAREQAVKEKRDRKRDKKAEAAAQRAAEGDAAGGETEVPEAEA